MYFLHVQSLAASRSGPLLQHHRTAHPVPSPPLHTSTARPSSTIVLVVMRIQVSVLVVALQAQVTVVREITARRTIAAVTAGRMVGMAVDGMTAGTVQAMATQVAASAVDVAVMAAGRVVTVAHCRGGVNLRSSYRRTRFCQILGRKPENIRGTL